MSENTRASVIERDIRRMLNLSSQGAIFSSDYLKILLSDKFAAKFYVRLRLERTHISKQKQKELLIANLDT